MAYENYNTVAWSDGSPITSLKLAQMSTNTQQVKEVVDDKATGVLVFSQSTSQVPNATGYSNFTDNQIIALSANANISISENRYYRITVNVPAITVLGAGAEDSRYVINIYNGSNTSGSKIASWDVTPHTFSLINVATGTANIANEAVKSNSYPSRIGSGTYSVLQSTAGGALTNQNFILSVQRVQGLSANNAPAWRIEGSATAPIQIYLEDVGGT
jgi:hypothetical protein